MQIGAQKERGEANAESTRPVSKTRKRCKSGGNAPAPKPSYGEVTRATTARPRTVPQRPSSGERWPSHEEAESHSHSSGCTGDATLECGSGTRTLDADVDNSNTHDHTRTQPAPPDANTSRPSARQLKPFESDDEDDLWTLVTRSKPSGRKAALYVCNLDESASEEKFLEFIEKRSFQAGLKRPKVHTCSIIRREEGELGSWSAHLVIGLVSKYLGTRSPAGLQAASGQTSAQADPRLWSPALSLITEPDFFPLSR